MLTWAKRARSRCALPTRIVVFAAEWLPPSRIFFTVADAQAGEMAVGDGADG